MQPSPFHTLLLIKGANALSENGRAQGLQEITEAARHCVDTLFIFNNHKFAEFDYLIIV